MKNSRYLVLFLAGTMVLSMALFSQGIKTPQASLDEARGLFQQGKHSQVIAYLRELLLDPASSGVYPDAQFLMGRSLLSQGRLDEALKAFETIINSYPDFASIGDCYYQRGRIFYLQGEYQNAIQSLARFMEKFPKSELVSNAYYWTAESLYASAYLEEAKKVFNIFLQKYPDSNRSEAARYKISLIDLKKREQQLLQLLKWSHQENIRNMEDFQNREKSFEDAIRSYQKRLYSLADDDFKQELMTLQSKLDSLAKEKDQDLRQLAESDARVKSLLDEIQKLNQALDDAKEREAALKRDLNRPLADALASIEEQKAILDAREAALALKEKALEKASE